MMTPASMNNRWQGTMPGMAFCCLLFVAALRCEAQINLVPNAGFEESDTCTTMDFGVEGPLNWHSANGTPDHLQSCVPYGAFNGLPMNFLTFQESFEGSSCVGVQTYHQSGSTEYREWIQAALLEPMVIGQTYYCSFRANAAFGGNAEYPTIWLASDKVGMIFTMQDRMWEVGDPYPVPPNYAHFMYPQVLADTVGWTLVSGSFVADSAYQYVMIGQFFSNALTDTLHFADPNSVFPWYPRGYTLVDAVCVSASPEGCDLGQGVGDVQATGPVLFPNPAQEQLIVGQRAGAEAQVLDGVGRVLWRGRISSERWLLGVGSWARGAYMLRMAFRGRVETHKFVLTE
ncbi:MAG: T9SS type A sorting domain-containing protein [Flavobacteriales bacterium]|nr:T9SS type A sorting domain-containing protein [Flavobacteriales bacterium]